MSAKKMYAQVTSKHIRIMGPDAKTFAGSDNPAQLGAIEAGIETEVGMIDWSDIEGRISDQLPEGYYCKIED
jgi:hypothetical protein